MGKHANERKSKKGEIREESRIWDWAGALCLVGVWMGLYIGYAHAWPDVDRWNRWEDFYPITLRLLDVRYEGAKRPHRMGAGRIGEQVVEFRDGELDVLLGPAASTKAEREMEMANSAPKDVSARWNGDALMRVAPIEASADWARGRMESSVAFAASSLVLGLGGGLLLYRRSRGRSL
jgi:hypothetical protein